MLILFIRTEALDEGTSLEMLPERLRTEIAIHVHLDTLRKVRFSIWLLIFTSTYLLTAHHACVAHRAVDIYKQLTIIGRDEGKYDYSEAGRSVIFPSRWLGKVVRLRDAVKSRYLSITEFNNCFTIRSPSLFSYLITLWQLKQVKVKSELSFFTRVRGYSFIWAECYFQ